MGHWNLRKRNIIRIRTYMMNESHLGILMKKFRLTDIPIRIRVEIPYRVLLNAKKSVYSHSPIMDMTRIMYK